MATRKSKDRMAWFKMDAGSFLAETMGLSNTHVAIYIKLMSLYWTSGNQLPDIESVMRRRVGLTNIEDFEILSEVLTEFFPKDSNGKYSHAQLDTQLADVREFSAQQSARARTPRNIVPDNDADQF